MVVLTAGHCWSATTATDLIIGPVNTTEAGGNRSRVSRRIGRVAEYRIHPDFNTNGNILVSV